MAKRNFGETKRLNIVYGSLEVLGKKDLFIECHETIDCNVIVMKIYVNLHICQLKFR